MSTINIKAQLKFVIRLLINKRIRKYSSSNTDLIKKIYCWKKKSNFEYISLGQNCNTAWYLKSAGLKKASYPFDWIFSSFSIVLDCIKDNFQKFLDVNLIESKGKQAGHKGYHSHLFNHKNPLKSPKEYKYYTRCVKRFTTILNKEGSILFICTVLNEKNKRPTWAKGFHNTFEPPKIQDQNSAMEMVNLISNIKPNSKFLFIEQYTECPKPKFELVHESENCMWIKFYSIGKNNGVRYLDFIDDYLVKRLFYSLKMK